MTTRQGSERASPASLGREERAAARRELAAFLRRFRRNRIGTLGAAIVLFCALVAILAPLIAPYAPEEIFQRWRLQPPSPYFALGTDEFGRDILSRIIWGARISLTVGFISVGFAVVVGSTLGVIAGYAGGWLDNLIMRCMDVLFAFPAILLAIGIMAVLGPGMNNAMLAVGVVYTPGFARVARAPVLSLKRQEFVEAARAMGARSGRIVFGHILPNALAPIIVQATLGLSTAILTEAALSFLGLGTPPPTPSWGTMLNTSRRFTELAPWTAVFPGLAIMLVVFGFNLFGDGLRDVLDPRLRRGD